ncbi:hypothetical protein [Nocardioides sp. GXZ039]|uniref:hypothetical protein n=1 Tax=Nocardioides sp. GXZ039 TaxID=3136018 RepID=UPI0030F437F3
MANGQGNMQGMDTEHAREVSNQMGEHAGQVSGVCQRLLARVSATSWTGPDKEAITSDIGDHFLPNANAASESINEQARLLSQHADAQDAVSS